MWGALIPIHRVVTLHKLRQVGAGERILLEGEMAVGAQIVDPERFRLRLFATGPAVKKEYVGLDALGVKDTGGQAQERMHIALLQQFTAHSLPGPAFKEDIIGYNHGCFAVNPGDGLDVLDKIELFVAGGGPEVIAHNRLGLALEFAFIGHIGDTALLAKGWVGQHHLEAVARVLGQAVINPNRADGAVLADAV